MPSRASSELDNHYSYVVIVVCVAFRVSRADLYIDEVFKKWIFFACLFEGSLYTGPKPLRTNRENIPVLESHWIGYLSKHMPSKFVLLDVFLQGDQKNKKQSHFHHVIEKWNPNVAPKSEHMKAELKTVQSAAIDVVSWSDFLFYRNPWNVVPLVKAFGFRTFEMDKEVVVRYLLAAISAHKLLQAFQRVEELDRLLSFHKFAKWGLEVSEEKISLKTLEETLEETLEFVRKQGDSMVNMDLMDAFEGYMSVLARNFFLCGLEPIRGHKNVVTATVGYLNEEEAKEFVAVHKRLVRQPGGAWSGGVGMTFTHITGGAFCCWSLSGRGVGSEPGEVCKIWEEEKQQCMETALNSVAHTLSGLHFGYHLDDLGRTSWKP
ncbi:hypothetical protein SELMODRAFT_417813 [Selaginella moellendorffii]|uniref:Uncharacterized protein n=1 Tax=Selaginella moellendorffii TaxID=88036 RepID=D8S3Q0_SELML|nr:hypothetical protein SELMODRAFT_417813 [Selaginella moellendorffii]